MKIIDVSYHNGNIDFSKVKADGVDGVIIRAGFGKNNIDKKFKTYIKDAIAAGLPVGIYWFSYAYSVGMAKKEAEYCLAAIKGHRIDLPVFFDWEYDSMKYAKNHGVNPGRTLITQMNKAFCQAVAKAGYKAGFYFNKDYADRLIDVSGVGNYVTWYARYTSAQQSGYDLWQYSSTGKVSGISGNVDCNKVLNEKALIGGSSSSGTAMSASSNKIAGSVGASSNKIDILGGIKMPTIKSGSEGKAVKIWQVIVGETDDGIFGTKTDKATRAFQKKHGLTEDGIVGPKTWKAGLESV